MKFTIKRKEKMNERNLNDYYLNLVRLLISALRMVYKIVNRLRNELIFDC